MRLRCQAALHNPPPTARLPPPSAVVTCVATLNAAAFAPGALRRASPKRGENHAERRWELVTTPRNAWTLLLCGLRDPRRLAFVVALSSRAHVQSRRAQDTI